MLRPDSRRYLLECLRPPPGYELDCAVGTTFSLDLLTLLTAPLAFTLFDWEDSDGRVTIDPIATLEALRRNAGRIHVFCQIGQMAIPRRSHLLFAHLEDSVHEVRNPKGTGVFHPKVWVLRFMSTDGPAAYRVLCLSRNLTFDRSWDTALVLDGSLGDRVNAYAINQPLGDFIAALPGLASSSLPSKAMADIDRVQYEIRRVKFDPPDGFTEIRFWPLGIKGAPTWPFQGRMDRLLVVSPFLSPYCLGRLARSARSSALVSRLESLENTDPSVLQEFAEVLFMNPAADPEGSGADEMDEEPTTGLSGLHAKVYVADVGWNARVWTGSANATDAAFSTNVEFLVELKGKKSRCGIDTLLNQDGARRSFRDLLQEFDPSEMLPQSTDPHQLKAEQVAEDIWRDVCGTQLQVQIISNADESYGMTLCPIEEKYLSIPPVATLKVWPITLAESAAATQTCQWDYVASFEALSFEALTSFFAFEISATVGEFSSTRRFVLNLPLLGAPANRQERLLFLIIRNREQFVRLLLHILSEGGIDTDQALQQVHAATGGTKSLSTDPWTVPLFESLVQALRSHPEKLDRIAKVVDDLKKTTVWQDILPEGFDEIWNPIWAARGSCQ